MVLLVLQLDRLEALMTHARMYSLPVDDLTAPSDSDDESSDKVVGVKAALQHLQSIQQMYGTPGAQTPPRWVTLALGLRAFRVQQLYNTPDRSPGGQTPSSWVGQSKSPWARVMGFSKLSSCKAPLEGPIKMGWPFSKSQWNRLQGFLLYTKQ